MYTIDQSSVGVQRFHRQSIWTNIQWKLIQRFFFLLNIHKFNVWICGRTDLLQFFVTAVSSMNNSGKYFDIHFALPLYLLLLPSRVLMVFALSFIVQNAYYQIEILLLMIDFFFLASEGFFINLSFNLMLSDYMYQ